MKKIVLRYGAYGALAELVLFVLTWLIIWCFEPSHATQGYIGWLNLLVPLLFIYFGVRYYRDQVNGGEISLLKGIKLGMLITLIPAIAFAIIETVFVIYIEPDFYENISKYDLEHYRATLSPDAYAVKAKEVEAQLALSNNPIFNFAIMIVTVLALGTIVSVISGLLLMKKSRQKN